jgi:hypothetical protein
MELSPSWVAEELWLSSALSASCSPSWVTCATTGMVAKASIAKSAANKINFFNTYLLFDVTFSRSLLYNWWHETTLEAAPHPPKGGFLPTENMILWTRQCRS